MSVDRSSRQELQLRAIREILRASTEALPIDDILTIITNIVIIVFDATTAWLMRIEDGMLQTRVARGEHTDNVPQNVSVQRLAGDYAPRYLEHPITFQPAEIDRSDPLLGVFADTGLAVTVVPIRAGERPVGLLGFTMEPTASIDLLFPITMADQAAAAIVSAKEREEARTWRERLGAVFDQMAEPVMIFDAEGRLTLFNNAAASLLSPRGVRVGATTADLVDKLDLTHPDGSPIKPEETSAARAFRRQRGEIRQEYVIETDAGRRFVETRGAPLILDGRVAGAVDLWRDITAFKEAEEERARLLSQVEGERTWLRTVIDNSPVGIILVEDVHGRRVVANRQAEALFGRPLPPEGGIDQYVGQIYHVDGTPLVREELATLRALHGETITREEELLRRPDGESRVYASAVPISRDHQIIGAVVIYEDITRIRELERLREEWTSIVAHDLRQPVTVISGYASILDREVKRKALPEQTARMIEHIIVSTQSLNRMVDDLLDVSRIESGRLEIERCPVEMPRLVRGVVERMAAVTGDHPLYLRVHGEIPRVRVDPSRIEQVLTNLLSNAAKYSFPRSEIDVDVQRRGPEVEVAVTNRGPGIPESEMPHLFTRFYRARGARREGVPGLGLGLYISRGIVVAHGGRIWATSIPNQTTTFFFTVPVDQAG